MQIPSFCLIGQDQLLIYCGQVLLEKQYEIKRVFSDKDEIKNWCIKQDIICERLEKIQDLIDQTVNFDYLLSLSNPLILEQKILKLPNRLAVNYHNSLLPSYGGTNATAWAILQGEKQHGITWHIMTEAVDDGDILLQKTLPIDADDTAISLNLKCHELAKLTFSKVLEMITQPKIISAPQSKIRKSYFKTYDRPFHAGLIDWNMPGALIYQYYRGLFFDTYDNQIATLKFIYQNQMIVIQHMLLTTDLSLQPAGTIIRSTEKGIEVATSTHNVLLKALALFDGTKFMPDEFMKYYQLKGGDRLPVLKEIDYQAAVKHLNQHAFYERFWLKAWEKIAHVTILGQTTHVHQISPKNQRSSVYDASTFLDLNVYLQSGQLKKENIKSFLLMMIAVYLYRQNQYEDASFLITNDFLLSENKIENEKAKGLGGFSELAFCESWLPFNLSLSPDNNLETVKSKIAQLIENLISNKSYLKDVSLRYHQIAQQQTTGLIKLSSSEYVSEELRQNTSISTQPLIHFIFDSKKRLLYVNTSIQLEEESVDYAHMICQHLDSLMQHALSEPDVLVNSINLVSKSEHEKILEWSNYRFLKLEYPPLFEIFRKTVDRHPEKIALAHNEVTLTYSVLNQRVNKIAAYLMKFQSLRDNAGIILFMDNGLEAIIGMLVALKLNCYYIPLPKATPESIIQGIIENSPLSFVFVNESDATEQIEQVLLTTKNKPLVINLKDEIVESDILSVEHQKKLNDSSNALAYVMYTSGSTGSPKGVAIQQKGVARLVCDPNYIKIKTTDFIAHAASIAFDASTLEIWGALLNGATLIIVDKEWLITPDQFSAFLKAKKITILWLTAQLFDRLVEVNPDIFPTLRYLLVGGDALNVKHINLVNDALKGSDCQLINGYGPTENTTFTTTYPIDRNRIYHRNVPIGKPITNTSVLVVDRYNNLLPVGMAGELIIAGEGLSLGYINNEKANQAHFIKNLQVGGLAFERIYRSNDMVYWNSCGDLEYIGRNDHVVKIRGYRIDLDNIKNHLLRHPLVEACHLIIEKADGHKKLHAYIQAIRGCGKTTLRESIIQYLKNYLFDFMLPQHFFIVETIPLNRNGKVNEIELKNMVNFSLPFVDENLKTDLSSLIEELIEIWAKMLGHRDFSVTDNYFYIGGDSINIGYIILSLKNKYQTEVSISEFLANSTIQSMAQLIQSKQKNDENCLVSFGNRDIALIKQDMQFDVNLGNQAVVSKRTNKEIAQKKILLTGVSGLIGSHLLKVLLENTSNQIFCLIRNDQIKNSRDFLHWVFPHDSFKIANYYARIQVIHGDLSKPILGLEKEIYQLLCETIDEIYHVGAYVNHIYDYSMLRDTNVNSTKTIMELATQAYVKPIVFISTLSAMDFDDEQVILEEWSQDETAVFKIADGYSQTKWVSEFILRKLASKGHPIKIIRPGWVLGKNFRGEVHNNHLVGLLRSCIELQVAPDWDCNLKILPANFAAQVIFKIIYQIDDNKIYNLTNENGLSWHNIIQFFIKQGNPINFVPVKDWVTKYLPSIKADNSLMPFISLYFDKKYNRIKYPDMTSHVIQNNTTSLVHINGITFPNISLDDLNSIVNLNLSTVTSSDYYSMSITQNQHISSF